MLRVRAFGLVAFGLLAALLPLGCTELHGDDGEREDGGRSGADGGASGGSGSGRRDGGGSGSRDPGAKDAGSTPGMDAGADGSAQDGGSEAAADGGDSGSGGSGDAATPESRCASANGGCDSHATCTDDASDPGAEPTCACASGFAGDGKTCGAVIASLQLSAGTLQPALAPDVTSYTIAVPITTQRLTFTPTAPAIGTIVFNDDAIVASGSDWQSPLLELGFNSFSAKVQQPGRPDRDYVFNVVRGKQEAYLKGSMLAAQDCMGWSVDIDGDTLVVGAPGDIDNGPLRGGSAYVFVRSGTSWQQQARLQADTPVAGDYFGASVAVSGDTIAVGASGESETSGDDTVKRRGAVYVFTRSAGSWSKQARLQASNGDDYDFFGNSVDLADDTLAVGAVYEDSAQKGVSTTAPTDNDASTSGAAYVFTRSAGSWTQRAYFKSSQTVAGDEFGTVVAVGRNPSGSQYTLAVGAPVDAIGAVSYAGSVTIFRGSGASWSEEVIKSSSAPESYAGYGQSVAVDGNAIVVGAPREGTKGKFYVYYYSSGAWQTNGPFAANMGTDYDYYGGSVAISGDMVAISASAEDGSGTGVTASPDELASDSGALYLYTFQNGFITLTQSYYVKASRVDPGDGFGTAIAMSGSAIVVGARGESSKAVTVDGDAADNSAGASGAAYVIR